MAVSLTNMTGVSGKFWRNTGSRLLLGLLCPLTLLLSADIAHAGAVGDYSNVDNLPGYIDLDGFEPDDYLHIPDDELREFEHRSASRILREDYMRKDGSVDTRAIDDKILAISKHESLARMTYCVQKLPKQANHAQYCALRSDAKLNRKWREEKIHTFYRYIIAELQEAKRLAPAVNANNINSPASQKFLKHLFQGLEVFASLKDIDPMASYEINSFQRYGRFQKAVIGGAGRIEAGNLLIPASLKQEHPELRDQVFFNPKTIARYVKDTSLLHPPSSGYWRNPVSVRNFNTSNYNGETQDIETFANPDAEIAVVYRPKIFSGATPKMRVIYGGQKWKMKFSMQKKDVRTAMTPSQLLSRRFGSPTEVHVETAVNNLAAAVGISVTPTYYKRSVRMYFEQDDPTDKAEFDRLHSDMLIEQKRYRSISDPISLMDIKQDEEGQYYVQMHSVSFEKSSDADDALKVGAFLRSGFSRKAKREFRGGTLFLAWIADFDTKDDNHSIVLNYGIDNKYHVSFSQADMGYALGSLFGRDAPNFLNRDLIDHALRDRNGLYSIMLNYRGLRWNYMFQHLTIDDAKWMTRLIAQLSPAQIEAAFKGAGYSDLLSKYYAQILLRRRDDLAKTLGIMGETIVDGKGNRIFIEPESDITDPRNFALKGYEKYFKDGYLYSPDEQIVNNPKDVVAKNYDAAPSGHPGDTLLDRFYDTLLAHAKIKTMNEVADRISSLHVSNRTFGMPMLEGNSCTTECWYDGVSVGITSFMPNRYLLTSGDDILRVDVFRFGFFLGTEVSSDLPQRYGLDASVGGKAPILNATRVYEFIKVKKVGTVIEAAKDYHKLYTRNPLYHHRIREQLVESLEDNEALISSVYMVFGLNAKLTSFNQVPSFLLEFKAGMNDYIISRTAIMRNADKYHLQFTDANVFTKSLAIGGNLLLKSLPYLKLEWERLERSDKEYELSSDKKDLLIANVNRTSPSDELDGYQTSERTLQGHRRSTSSIFTFLDDFDNHSVKSIAKTDTGGNRSELHGAKYELSKKIMLGLESRSRIIQSMTDGEGNMLVKLDMDLSAVNGTRRHFMTIYDTMLPLLGEQYLMFTPADVVFHINGLTFEAEAYVASAGLANIFSHSHEEMCLAYARNASVLKANGIRMSPQEWCDAYYAPVNFRAGAMRSKQHARFGKFAATFVKAKQAFHREDNSSENLRERASLVAKLFSSNKLHPETWRALLALAGTENIYRYAKVYSRFGVFPGQEHELIMPKVMRGGANIDELKAQERSMLQSVSMYSDPLLSDLQMMFYNRAGEHMLPVQDD
ncbi:MAG: hypothetical protein OYH77_07545 [Pseudomonadota bacterium]|nr:hypothetical protein [Pseudomonadota bacterium]